MRRVPLAVRPVNLPWRLKLPESMSPELVSVTLKVLFFLTKIVSSMLVWLVVDASPPPPSVG